MEGTRLAEAKAGACDYLTLATARGYAVGAVAFAGAATVLAPPGRDPAGLTARIRSLEVRVPGTDIADAITVGASIVSQRATAKVLVLCTDGEPQDRDGALAAASRAKANGFSIHALAIEGADVDFLRRVVSDARLIREARADTIGLAMRSLAGLLGRAS